MLVGFVGSPCSGKCHKVGTKIMLSDGTTKEVQDIKPGDFLMGPDGEPRKVLSTTVGFGNLYDIVPRECGNAWGCNDAHILSLKRAKSPSKRHRDKKYNISIPKGAIVNISVSEYLKSSKNFKKYMKLWRASLDFQEKKLTIPPYVFGLWLGDGHSHIAALTTMDEPLKKEWIDWMESNGDTHSVYSQENNKASTYAATCSDGQARVASSALLRRLGVLNNKHIPHEYLTSSRSQRLELLAGIIDTDGYSPRGRNCMEIVTVREELSKNYTFLARSLGFRVSTYPVRKKSQNGTEGTYFKTSISGNLSQIPVKLIRKKSGDSQRGDPSVNGFDVIPSGEGNYYGFTLSGDGLYLLEDFTVTHNTTSAATLFARLKDNGFVAEFVPEQARSYIAKLRYECSQKGEPMRPLTDVDQLKIMLEQKYLEKVFSRNSYKSVVVTDCASFLAMLYMSEGAKAKPIILNSAKKGASRFDLLFRCHPVQVSNLADPNRVHTFEQSKELDAQLDGLINLVGVPPEKVVDLAGPSNIRSSRAYSVLTERLLSCHQLS